MKSSDKPQFSKKWWTSEKPSEIKGQDLEKALGNVEHTLADEKKHGDEKAVEACCSVLEELGFAVDKTVKKECDKKKHKDLIAVLDKFEGLIKDELKRLEETRLALEKVAEAEGDGESEEDESEGKLFEKDYLYKMVKLLKSGGKEMNFGFGLNAQAPEGSQLLLKRKGNPDMLFKALKRTGSYSNRCLTYGTALADPDDSKTLLFRLDGSADEPPQIIKLGRRFLRGDKSLKFRKLKVILAGGNTLVDDEPDDEEGTSGGPAGAGDANQAISPEEMENIRKELADMTSRLDELFAQHVVNA